MLYLFLFFLSLFLSFFPRKEGRLTYSLPAPVFSRYRSYHSCHHRKAGRAGAGARLGLGWVGLVLTSCTVPYHTARQPCHESHVLFCFCFLFLFCFCFCLIFNISHEIIMISSCAHACLHAADTYRFWTWKVQVLCHCIMLVLAHS